MPVTSRYNNNLPIVVALLVLLSFLLTFTFEVKAADKPDQLASAPKRLTTAGYLSEDPAPLANGVRAAFNQVLFPAAIHYLTSYASSFGMGLLTDRLPGRTILPVLAIIWSFTPQEPSSLFWYKAGMSAIAFFGDDNESKLNRAVRFSMFFLKLLYLLEPDLEAARNAKKRVFQLEHLPDGYKIQFHKVEVEGTTTAGIKVSWPAVLTPPDYPPLTHHAEAFVKLARSGQQQGFSGISIHPAGGEHGLPLQINYIWCLSDGSVSAQEIHTLTLAETEHLSWWSDALLNNNLLKEHANKMVFGDPLSPDILRRLARLEEGTVSEIKSDNWQTELEVLPPLGLLSAPGHFDIWLYPGATSLFSLYHPTLPELILTVSDNWNHKLNEIEKHITYPELTPWGRLPFRLFQFALTNILADLGARQGYEQIEAWQREQRELKHHKSQHKFVVQNLKREAAEAQLDSGEFPHEYNIIRSYEIDNPANTTFKQYARTNHAINNNALTDITSKYLDTIPPFELNHEFNKAKNIYNRVLRTHNYSQNLQLKPSPSFKESIDSIGKNMGNEIPIQEQMLTEVGSLFDYLVLLLNRANDWGIDLTPLPANMLKLNRQ